MLPEKSKSKYRGKFDIANSSSTRGLVIANLNITSLQNILMNFEFL